MSTGTSETRPPLPLIFAVTATGISANTLITPVIYEILVGLDAPIRFAGLVLGAATFPGIFLAPIIGLLADRYGRREVLVGCLALFGVSGGLAAMSVSLPMLVVLRFLQGIGSAGLVNLAIVIIGDHWEGRQRSAMIGRNAAVLTVGLAVMPLIGGALTEVGSWRTPFLLYPLALLTAFASLRLLPRSVPRDVRVAQQLRDAVPVIRQREVLAAMGSGIVAFLLIFGLVLTVLPIYLVEEFGASPITRAGLFGLSALSNTAVVLWLGRLQRFGKRAQLLAATGFFTVALVAIGGASGMPVVFAAMAFFGAGEGLMISNLQDTAAGAAGPETRGTTVAVFAGASRLGQTVGPLVAGFAAVALGAQASFTAGAVLAVVLLAPLALLARGRERRQHAA